MSQLPTIGRIVHYKLSEQDAAAINKRRQDALNINAEGHTISSKQTGAQVHFGNSVGAGDVYPAMIVRVWPNSSGANLQVSLDGNDTFWATSVTEGDGERHYVWPPRV